MVGMRLDDHLYANGMVTSWAPGVVVIEDNDPPPAPVLISPTGNPADTQTAPGGAYRVIWWRDVTTPDLAGYQIEYSQPDWEMNDTIGQILRVLPTSPKLDFFFERARLPGTLHTVDITVCVRAFDASGNLSGCTPVFVDGMRDPAEGIGPPEDIEIGVDSGLFAFQVSWMEPVTGTAAGYLVGYEPVGCLLPGATSLALEGPSPFNHTNLVTLEEQFSELTLGQTYRLWVRAYNAGGSISTPTEETVMLIDSFDGDADTMPDEWESLFGVFNPIGDEDGDGLVNQREQNLGTNPLHADSDGDGFYDGEEGVSWGTDPCGPEQPPYHLMPLMTISGGLPQPVFTVATNQATFNEPVYYQVINAGNAELNWNAVASEPWVTLEVIGNDLLKVGVDLHGFPVDVYSATVTIINQASIRAVSINEEYGIDITAVVLPLKRFDPAAAVNLSGIASGNDLLLNWNHLSPNGAYELHRSDTPYFAPDGGSLLETLDAPAASYVDINAIPALGEEGAPGFFYLLRSFGFEGDTATSNRLGLLTFEITPGSGP
jgi:hypothetical protein